MFAFFAFECGWSKEQTGELSMREMHILIEKYNEMNDPDPSEKKKRKVIKEISDREVDANLDRLESNKYFNGRTPGVRRANVQTRIV